MLNNSIICSAANLIKKKIGCPPPLKIIKSIKKDGLAVLVYVHNRLNELSETQNDTLTEIWKNLFYALVLSLVVNLQLF
jgi:hypothetical protein